MKHRSAVVAIAWSLTAVAVGSVGWVAGKTAATPPAAAQPSAMPLTVAVEEMTVEATEPYPVHISWPLTSTTPNGRAGTLTSVADLAQPIAEGDTVYTVDLLPVVAAQGEIASFRSLSQGARGKDVRQLEELLIRLGYFHGSADDQFDARTSEAVDQWGKDLGLDLDGLVARGMVLFVPTLPARFAHNPEVRIGAEVMPGHEVLKGVAVEPVFTASVLPEAMERFKEGQLITLPASGYRMLVSRIVDASDGDGMVAELGPEDGKGTICGQGCVDLVEVGGTSNVTGQLEVVPSPTGPGIPTAAIWTDPAGATCVESADGIPKSVTVIASVEGRSVVKGLSVGQTINAAPDRDATC